MAKLHLHHLENSRSFRIVWLLEELGLEYQLTTYERKNGLAPKRLKHIHPLGKAPILQDTTHSTGQTTSQNTQDSSPQPNKTLVESAVIMEYLIDHYDTNTNSMNPELLANFVKGKQFRPDYATTQYEDYRYWLHFAESSLMPLLVMELMLTTMVKKSPLPIRPISKLLKKGINTSYLDQNLQSQLAWIDKHLATHDWFAGEQFTAADVQMAFGLEALQKGGSLSSKYANIHNWLKKCQARPAYQQAVAKGGELWANKPRGS